MMKKTLKRLLSLLLTLAILINMDITVFAGSNTERTLCTNLILKTSKNMVVTNEGIYTNGVYYTKEDFIQLLDTAQEIEMYQTYSADIDALIAGTWFIPGIGEVVITIAGTIIIGKTIIEASSWIYDAVKKWFAEKAVQEAYAEAKEKGEPTDNHSVQTGSSLPTTGSPHSSKDLEDDKGVKQRRYYDKDGNADMDIDYRHGGTGHKFPHRHDWKNGVRGPAY